MAIWLKLPLRRCRPQGAFPVKPDATSLRVAIRSRLAITGSSVFGFNDQKLAVLHG